MRKMRQDPIDVEVLSGCADGAERLEISIQPVDAPCNATPADCSEPSEC